MPLPARPPTTAPTAAPATVPPGPATLPAAAPAAMPPAAAPRPVPTGCAPGVPVIGSRFGLPRCALSRSSLRVFAIWVSPRNEYGDAASVVPVLGGNAVNERPMERNAGQHGEVKYLVRSDNVCDQHRVPE